MTNPLSEVRSLWSVNPAAGGIHVTDSTTLTLGVVGALSLLIAALLLVQRRSKKITSGLPPMPSDVSVYLEPILRMIGDLQRKIDDSRLDAASNQSSLIGELGKVLLVNGQLLTQGQDLGRETVRISEALSNSTSTGDWGELQLERTLELANMTEHVSWTAKEQTTSAGRSLYPDVTIKLPNSRKVVIDAKAPKIDLTGDPQAAENLVEALREHIDDLAGRDYSSAVSDAVDFVVLFVPTEGILATALRTDPKLIKDSLEKRILLASPMTLLALLRAVEFGWKQLEQARNALQIVASSKDLVNSLTSFVEKFNVVASGLTTAIRNYNEAASYLENTVNRQAKKVVALGVTTNGLEDVKEVETNVARTVDWEQ